MNRDSWINELIESVRKIEQQIEEKRQIIGNKNWDPRDKASDSKSQREYEQWLDIIFDQAHELKLKIIAFMKSQEK
ncbi:hypothetical protein Lgra_1382 [Legionella gratiana]|uniref:Uncharacterized protein n=1 Tax=Legionella gratiana TaxID=45066 RepID=A0A378JHK6_9GAMM|nr:hypothetical protein [Legionella gratiana]KTD11924.1 hypothetical protein Lgra_1382 [Legionella gratiana]STX46471.1 Uncharacterised protein [Legionella gratiana]